jgi:hypothetical protein
MFEPGLDIIMILLSASHQRPDKTDDALAISTRSLPWKQQHFYCSPPFSTKSIFRFHVNLKGG